MLFNSYVFIFLFLPITLSVFYLSGSFGYIRLATAWLVGASLFFYGWWNPAYVALIIASIFANYSIGTLLISNSERINKFKPHILSVGIGLNLSLLAYYKYANFFIDNVNHLTSLDIDTTQIILPLAISFFTFQQVAYLVDTYQGKTRELNFLHYCLFVTFFPQLIAGPIVHHKEMLPQFANHSIYRFDPTCFTAGISLFFLGLFKKVILADSAAEYATPVFEAAAGGMQLTIFEGWGGALAYTFQLYFDFSAYSDMAVGLGLLFGIRLPINFYSPYKATSIVDFWRRWHITLSRFLRDYLYIPLGGNRKGNMRRNINLMITMLLGGLWHGAGWTFVLWGGLHGLYLSINHVWTTLRARYFPGAQDTGVAWRYTSGTITFLAVVIAWVLFRAEDLGTATTMYRSMFGFNGLSLPESLLGSLGGFESIMISHGINFNGMFGNRVFQPSGVLLIVLLSCVVWLMPNLQDIMGKHGALRPQNFFESDTKILWKRTLLWASLTGLATGMSILGLSRASEFLYFQF